MSRFQRGSLIALEQRDRGAVNKRRFQAEVARALAAGFTEAEAPFAASARLLRGPTTVAIMRAHLRKAHPGLYEDES